MLAPDIVGGMAEGGEIYITSPLTCEYFKVDSKLNQYELQKNLEDKQIQEFNAVLKKENSEYTFTEFARGKTDPPDFFIVRKNKKIGLELTAITNEQRNSSVSKLVMIRDYFRTQHESGKFQNIQGLTLRFKFNGNIPRKIGGDFEAQLLKVVDFIDSLKIPDNFKEEAQRFFTENRQIPAFFDKQYSSTNISVSIASVSEVSPTEPQSEIGFTLDIDYQLEFKLEDIKKLITEKIVRKDRPENQELLIVVGGPNQRGIGNVDEARAMFYFLSKNLVKLDKPNYLKRIFILLWPMSKHYLFDFSKAQKFFRYEKKRRR